MILNWWCGYTQAVKTQQLAVEHGLNLRYEAFADRGYTSRGLLLGGGKTEALLNKRAVRPSRS